MMRRRRKGPLALAKQKADKAWAFRVKENADWRCEACGKDSIPTPSTPLHAHHFVSRSYARLRFDIRNGVALCPRDHLFGRDSAHKGGPLFTEWFKRTRPDDYAYIMHPSGELRAEHNKTLHRTEADYLEIAEALGPESSAMEDAA